MDHWRIDDVLGATFSVAPIAMVTHPLHTPYEGVKSMSAYRRCFVPGGTYFFTVVTYNRYPFFKEALAVDMLRDSWLKTQANLTFSNIASVVLPDHFHCLWSLPPNDDNFSKRLKSIKDIFTTSWLASGGHEEAVSDSARSRGCRGIWQPRFWEHVIRDEDDLENHFDYIHFNPVKHGYVTHPSQWPHSTYHRYASIGHYSSHWGRQKNPRVGINGFVVFVGRVKRAKQRLAEHNE